MSRQDIFDMLLGNYDQLTRQERQIGDYILEHKMSIPYITISERATACGVGTATITRFVQKMGCDSFKEFKIEALRTVHIQKSPIQTTVDDVFGYGDITPMDSIEEKSQKLCNIGVSALTKTLAELDPESISKAVDLLCEADSVFCFGQGNSSIMAMEAWGCFAYISKKFQWIADTHMQAAAASMLGEKDVILYFSYSGSTRELVGLRDMPRRTKAKIILVTRFPESPGGEIADVVLFCGANESPRQQGSVAIKLAQLLIVDILYNEYYFRELEISEANKNRSLASTIPLLY